MLSTFTVVLRRAPYISIGGLFENHGSHNKFYNSALPFGLLVMCFFRNYHAIRLAVLVYLEFEQVLPGVGCCLLQYR